MIKYMKKSAVSVIAIIALLVLQAVCDLALPDYTSKIVNVGIQQHGIENAVPEVITKGDLDNLLIFMNSEDKNEVLDNYTYLDKASEATKKDVSGDEPIYELNTQDEETINKLFIREKGVVQPIYKISEKRKAVAQILIALLTAFENALATPNAAFEFSIKTVRQRCMDCNVYETDFILNFKNRAGLFHNVDSEVVKLTPTGKAELANVIAYISK